MVRRGNVTMSKEKADRMDKRFGKLIDSAEQGHEAWELEKQQENDYSEMFKKIKNGFSNETKFVTEIQKAFPGEFTEASCRAMYRGNMYLQDQIRLAEWKALNKLQNDIDETVKQMEVKEQW